MKIWVFALCYNESHFVKQFLTAYGDAEKIVIYDNMSTDNSVELLKQDPRVEIRTYDSGGKIRDDLYLEIKNNCWKEARGNADWVIVVDFDEIFTRVVDCEDGGFLFDLDLATPHNNGFNVIKPYGYNMVCLNAPLGADGHPHIHSPKGAYHMPSEKMCCFKPNELSEINFQAGCHWANPLDMDGKTDNVRVYFQPQYKLLHYKFWNLEHYMERMKDYQSRMSKQNEEHGWGYHYMQPLEDHYYTFVRGSEIVQELKDIKSPYDEE